MTMALVLRRGFVIVGVAAALMLGAASIRAAAEWTAASAPLAVAPASLTSIEAALQTERDRSAALEGQLRSLESASGDLGTALKAAQDQIDTGATTAATLQASLKAAQSKLASLQAALAKAAAAAAVRPATTTTTSSGAAAPPAPVREPNDD